MKASKGFTKMKFLFLLSTLLTAFSTFAANSPIIWNASCVGTQAYNLGNNLCLTDNGTGPYLPLSGGTITGDLTVNTLTTEGPVVYSSDAFSSLIITPSGTDIAIGNGINAPDGSGGVAVGVFANGSYSGAALVSYSNGSGGVAVGNSAYGFSGGTAVGAYSYGVSDGTAVGNGSDGSYYGAAVGFYSNGSSGGVAVGNSSNGSSGGVAVGDGSNTNGINGAVAIGGDVNSVYPAIVPSGFFLPTVQLGQGTAVLDGALNFGTGATVYPVMNSTGGLFGYSASSLDNGAITTDGSGNASFNSTTVTAIKNSATQTIVSCSLGGSITLSQPEQGSSYKKIVAYANSCHGTASYSFPTTFAHVPSIVTLATSGISAGYVTVLSTSTLTVNAGSTTSGNLIIEGY